SNLRKLTPEEYNRYVIEPQAFKLHYIYREFTIKLKPLSKRSPLYSAVNVRFSNYLHFCNINSLFS
ncbi:MAG: hypothetical protein ACOYIG_12390, partial [Acetivibrionales bacterium]